MSRRSWTGSEESQGWTSPGQPAKSVESAFGFAEYVARTTRVGGNFPPAGGLWLSLLEINPCAATPASGAARIARWTDVRHRIVNWLRSSPLPVSTCVRRPARSTCTRCGAGSEYGSHVVFYVAEGEGVLIVRVLHESMDVRTHIMDDPEDV